MKNLTGLGVVSLLRRDGQDVIVRRFPVAEGISVTAFEGVCEVRETRYWADAAVRPAKIRIDVGEAERVSREAFEQRLAGSHMGLTDEVHAVTVGGRYPRYKRGSGLERLPMVEKGEGGLRPCANPMRHYIYSPGAAGPRKTTVVVPIEVYCQQYNRKSEGGRKPTACESRFIDLRDQFRLVGLDLVKIESPEGADPEDMYFAPTGFLVVMMPGVKFVTYEGKSAAEVKWPGLAIYIPSIKEGKKTAFDLGLALEQALSQIDVIFEMVLPSLKAESTDVSSDAEWLDLLAAQKQARADFKRLRSAKRDRTHLAGPIAEALDIPVGAESEATVGEEEELEGDDDEQTLQTVENGQANA